MNKETAKKLKPSLLAAAGLAGLITVLSCVVGDGMGFDSSGRCKKGYPHIYGSACFECNENIQAHWDLPECNASFVCRDTVAFQWDIPRCRAMFTCNPAKPVHWIIAQCVAGFCNPTMPGSACYDSCKVDANPSTPYPDIQDTCQGGPVEPTCTEGDCPLPQCAGKPCADTGDTEPECTIDYDADIQPIFDLKCVSCHGISSGDGLVTTGTPPMYPEGLIFYAVKMKKDNARHPLNRMINVPNFIDPEIPPKWRVRPYAPESSYVYTSMNEAKPGDWSVMPKGETPVVAEDKNKIYTWIKEGAWESLQACKDGQNTFIITE